MTGDPHPLEALRARAGTTSPAQVRAGLGEQASDYRALRTPDGWGAGAEDALRRAIGRERKMGMEMRIGLGAHAVGLPHASPRRSRSWPCQTWWRKPAPPARRR